MPLKIPIYLLLLIIPAAIISVAGRQPRGVFTSQSPAADPVPEFKEIASYQVSGHLHYSDPLGNVYIIDDRQLKKMDQDGHETGSYSHTYLGNITSADVSDPLRILLYYRQHNQVVWVDKYLNEIRSPIWLDDLGIDQAWLVCSSSQGGFWVFNRLNNQLQYFNAQLRSVHESISLNQLTGPDVLPTFMIEKSRFIYLNAPGTGILVFDRFGNHARTLPVNVQADFQVTDEALYYLAGDELFSYELSTADVHQIPIPYMEDLLKAELQPGLLFLFSPDVYSIYKTRP